VTTARFRIDWQTEVGHFAAIEPTLGEVTDHAAQLAASYNDPRNAELLGHTEPLSDDEVIDHYDASMEEGVRSFLLFVDRAAELAFLIAAHTIHGKVWEPRSAQLRGEPGDVTLVIDREIFARNHAAALEQISFGVRSMCTESSIMECVPVLRRRGATLVAGDSVYPVSCGEHATQAPEIAAPRSSCLLAFALHDGGHD